LKCNVFILHHINYPYMIVACVKLLLLFWTLIMTKIKIETRLVKALAKASTLIGTQVRLYRMLRKDAIIGHF